MTGIAATELIQELLLMIDGDLYQEFFTDSFRARSDRQRVIRNAVRMVQRRVRNNAPANVNKRKKKRAVSSRLA